jgi:hypothetical protein
VPDREAPGGAPDRDRDGRTDRTDNCVDRANAGQEDADEDGIGDVCEILPPGNRAPVAGRVAVVQQVSGDVYVKVPPGTALPNRVPPGTPRAPLSGYRPLEGVASVPVGSLIDARKGVVRLTTAADLKSGTSRRRLQTGTLTAAIFAVQQSRARRARVGGIPATDILLKNAPGTARACASSRNRSPKGVVRTFRGTAKGVFRTYAGASITTIRNASWITRDRCDGTLTRVLRGRASVLPRGSRRPVSVRAGRAYLAAARLYGARQRRQPT